MNAPDRMVLDLAERLFADHRDALGLPPADPLNVPLWSALVASDLFTLTATERLDGLPDACEVARQAGCTAARVPVVEALVASWVHAACGWGAPAWTEGLVTVAHAPDAAQGKDGRLDLDLPAVPHGAQARKVVILGPDTAWLLDATQAQAEPGVNRADEPRARLRFAGAPVLRRAALDGQAARALAAVLRTAAMAGAAQRTLAIALEHARTREQFGRPIGTFQAVQQMLAQLAAQVALVSAAADSAAAGHAARRDPLLAAAAKAAAGEAVGPIAEAAHQIVAAIGFTREHDLHRYTRRLWSWRDEDGSEHEWQQLLGRRLLASDRTLWQFVTALMSEDPGA